MICVCFFQELEDSFNYGLFQPPLNGRAGKLTMMMMMDDDDVMMMMMMMMLMLMIMMMMTIMVIIIMIAITMMITVTDLCCSGKFLDEERRLSEYPFQGSVGHLEVILRR